MADFMQDEKITLDRQVFKTLASGTRVDILKSLDQRRKTLSELARQFNMSVSTVKEHLDNMVAVELIVQMDDGHKWKYYDLTKKGKAVLHPEDKKVWILLGVSVLGIIALTFDAFRNSFMASFGTFAAAPQMFTASDEASGGMLMGAAKTAGERAAENAQAASFVLSELPYLHIVGFLVCVILIAASLLYIRSCRKNVKL
ncbi:MAG: winged helix-turn-helix domain-containing protein [Candidatus Aenigmarchaeota archaeon]|nr:winged helix-turn-helix domain-containing protein [Candidatus Aenigmarchaeota archaeon]